VAEFKMKQGDFELQIRTKDYYKAGKSIPVFQSSQPVPAINEIIPSPSSPPSVAAATAGATAIEATEIQTVKSNLTEIKSPIVGTFYRSPSPDKPAFVKVGDTIEAGSIVCIVEAMKLFNEIESEISGKIVEILVEDATPVEYDQVLFRVETK
ncbi:MAG TPA: acetyl-CoA carboxylase, biotin carboxyl carrier protein, partial [Saprospirales bacterium]|nr:acetyl-CoA carboxylase, biotin carboxyl carrier protein [Saprospirales bacterium]